MKVRLKYLFIVKMFAAQIVDRNAEYLAYLLEGHKSIPKNDTVLITFTRT